MCAALHHKSSRDSRYTCRPQIRLSQLEWWVLLCRLQALHQHPHSLYDWLPPQRHSWPWHMLYWYCNWVPWSQDQWQPKHHSCKFMQFLQLCPSPVCSFHMWISYAHRIEVYVHFRHLVYEAMTCHSRCQYWCKRGSQALIPKPLCQCQSMQKGDLHICDGVWNEERRHFFYALFLERGNIILKDCQSTHAAAN